MKIRFLKDTNIRISNADLKTPPLGNMNKGAAIEVENQPLKGAVLDGVSLWYRDAHGWYYWSGAAEVVEEKTTPELPGEAILEDAQDLIEANIGEEEEPVVEPPEKGSATGALPLKEVDAEVPIRDSTLKEEAPEEEQAESPAEDEIAPETMEEGPEAPVKEALFQALDFNGEQMNWGMRALQIVEYFWKERALHGEGVNVAILDTGIDLYHLDLRESVAAYRNFCGGGPEAIHDLDGNGTRCAGLIAARGREAVWGIAPRASLLVGKIMNNLFDISFARLLEGIDWALQWPVDIIYTGVEIKDNSLPPEQVEQLRMISDILLERGILLIAPVGNSQLVKPENRLPAALPGCLSVGAYNRQKQRFRTSLRSNTLDIMAPGEGLLATAPDGKVEREYNGSHAAAAFATGCMALAAQHIRENGIPVSIADLIYLIRETALAKAPGDKCQDVDYGCGFFNPIGLMERLGRD
ncbi:MAG: S8 family serine peptidase [Phaeodactylibacter sp.]|nr:S8 family serine peptidase [Phaeodactylibacter sp.]MCB0615617.1 S8 family serine peptidase [Phaeodactylibacter sp.]MCB9304606.1 S8 family serine peptidase [Lewinellaceae bacterium]